MMAKKARLGLYLEDEELKKQIKIAAAKHGTSVTDYCVEAIEDRLITEGERGAAQSKNRKSNARAELLTRMDQLRKAIGPIGIGTADLVKEGRPR